MIRRLCFALLCLCGLIWSVAAQNMSLMGAGGFKAAVASYTGPGDIASGAIGFWSCGRAYDAAYAASQGQLCTVVDSATGLASCTFNAGTNGYANLTATVCVLNTVSVTTFCTVTHVGCSVSEMFDQSGNGNHVVQATLANMPGLTFSAQNGLPCPAGTNTAAMRLATSGNISQSAPFSMTAVAERTGSTTTIQNIMNNNNVNFFRFTGSANTINGDNGTNLALTANDNAFHAMLIVASSTDPLFAIDSSSNTTTSSNGTTALANPEAIAGRTTGNQGLLAGYVCEAGIWPSDLNSVYTSMLANMRSATVGWNF